MGVARPRSWLRRGADVVPVKVMLHGAGARTRIDAVRDGAQQGVCINLTAKCAQAITLHDDMCARARTRNVAVSSSAGQRVAMLLFVVGSRGSDSV